MQLDIRVPVTTLQDRAIKDDAMLKALATRKPASIESWVQGNVNDLPTAKTLLAKLSMAVAWLIQTR